MIPQDSAPSVEDSAQDRAPSFGALPRGAAIGEVDTVDMALAQALADASRAMRFDVVLQLAKELAGCGKCVRRSLGEEEAGQKAETSRCDPQVKSCPAKADHPPRASLAWSRGDPGCEA